jgi:hypothetical protein
MAMPAIKQQPLQHHPLRRRDEPMRLETSVRNQSSNSTPTLWHLNFPPTKEIIDKRRGGRVSARRRELTPI